ncbi:hypothetical protein IRJ41_016618, partial [Triplophysa rosa]
HLETFIIKNVPQQDFVPQQANANSAQELHFIFRCVRARAFHPALNICKAPPSVALSLLDNLTSSNHQLLSHWRENTDGSSYHIGGFARAVDGFTDVQFC